MDRLSPELLHIVVLFLDIADRLSFRLVNRDFSVVGAAHILPEATFHLHAEDLANLRAVAANGSMARNVRSLTCFAARLESEPLPYDDYVTEYKSFMRMDLISPDLTEDRRWKSELSSAQLRAHYERYLEAIVSQHAIVEDRLDLECLKEVLPSFTNLQSVTMSAGHLFYEGRRKPKTSYDEYIRPPLENGLLAGAEQLEVILEALAYHQITVKDLRAGVMSWRFFERSSSVLDRLFSPLHDLRYIDLVLELETDDDGNDVTDDTKNCRRLLQRGAARDLLRSLPHLETLSFAIHSDFESQKPAASLDWIIEPGHHWPSLSEVTLEGLDCSEAALTNFLELHKGTLNDMCLRDISLTDGSWKTLLPWIRSNLYLHEPCICGRLSGYSTEGEGLDHDLNHPIEIYDLWTFETGPSDMRASVNCYCSKGGEKYPNELPLDQHTIRKYFESHVRHAGLKSEAEDAKEMRQAEREIDARVRSLDLFGFSRYMGLDDSDGSSLAESDFDENPNVFYGYELDDLNNDSEDNLDSSLNALRTELGDEDDEHEDDGTEV